MRSEVPGGRLFQPGDAEPVGQDADRQIVCSNLFFAPLDGPPKTQEADPQDSPFLRSSVGRRRSPPPRAPDTPDEVAAV